MRMTLGDLLVSIAVLALVMTANLTLLAEGRRAYEIGAAKVEAQQAGRIALSRLAREVRTAGAGTANVTFSAIAVAEPSRIVLQRDWNVDGVIAGRRETITWKLDGSVLRRDAGGGAQPIVNGVRALAFRYLDADDQPTSVPSAIRSVVIVLTTAPAGTASPSADVTTTLSTQVRLRNR